MKELNMNDDYFEYSDAYGTDLSVSSQAYEELGFDINDYDDMDYVTMTFPQTWVQR